MHAGNTVYKSSGNCLIETASKTLILGCKNSVIPTDGSVTIIGYGAFSYCEELTNISIPVSVTKIEREAFWDCRELATINYSGTTAQWQDIEKEDGWDGNVSTYTVVCSNGSITKQ